jgi:hypothetical protein
MIIDATGNVGVGTTSPVTNFHVGGNSLFGGDATVPGASPTYSGTWISFDPVGNVSRMIAANPSNAHMSFWTKENTLAPTEKMRITDTGNVGIGTTSPLSPLTIHSASSQLTLSYKSSGTVNINDLLGTINFYQDDASATSKGGVGSVQVRAETNYDTSMTPSYMAFYTHPNVANNDTLMGAATEKMRITASGNVGIGTTTPAAKLEVNGEIIRSMYTTSVSAAGYCNNENPPANVWYSVMAPFSYTKKSATSKLLIEVSAPMRFNYSTAGWGYFGLLINGTDYSMCGIYNSDAGDHHQSPYCRVLVTGLGAGAYSMQPRINTFSAWYCFDANPLVTIQEIY